MENNKNKKSVKFQGDMLSFCDFIQVFVFTRNHRLKSSFSLILIIGQRRFNLKLRYGELIHFTSEVSLARFVFPLCLVTSDVSFVRFFPLGDRVVGWCDCAG